MCISWTTSKDFYNGRQQWSCARLEKGIYKSPYMYASMDLSIKNGWPGRTAVSNNNSFTILIFFQGLCSGARSQQIAIKEVLAASPP